MSRIQRRRRRGFTLMEVLLVLVILVILGSMAGVFIRGARQKAFANSARSQIGAFEKSVKLYELDMHQYPSSSDGLQALRSTPASSNQTKWNGPYIDREITNDPWGNPYQYALDDPEVYRIWSYGPDGLDNTADDIRNIQ